MPIFEIRGIKDERVISEHAHSLTKAQWVAASYVEYGYAVTINELNTPSSGSIN